MSAINRNFPGRSGPGSVWLASPPTVAASAILGRLASFEALQRAAYGPVLGEAHPMFWAEKLHFYLTRAPFYNFPYAFGYFFSALVFARAREEGPAFAPRYAALLADTGRCTVEEVAARHLGVDLTDPAAWAPVIADIERLVERYAALVEARG